MHAKGYIAPVVAFGLLGAMPAMAVEADAAGVERLAWLAGGWGAERDGRWTEEHWLPPRGGVMLGISRAGRGDAVREFEFLRIQADADGVVTYWAMPGGAAAVPFKLVDSGERSATFENPAHDYPTRISYRREGDVLEAVIAGPDGANALRWTWQRLQQP